jgi:ribosomal protein S12 methylthiotransferase
MVGFPGETEEDVDNLISFINEIEFDHLGVFTYSKEEGTKSYNFKNQISQKDKNLRKRKVMKAQQIISYRKNKSHIGKEMTGLVIGTHNKYYMLRSYWNAPDGIDGNIYVKSSKPLEIGSKIRIKI